MTAFILIHMLYIVFKIFTVEQEHGLHVVNGTKDQKALQKYYKMFFLNAPDWKIKTKLQY